MAHCHTVHIGVVVADAISVAHSETVDVVFAVGTFFHLPFWRWAIVVEHLCHQIIYRISLEIVGFELAFSAHAIRIYWNFAFNAGYVFYDRNLIVVAVELNGVVATGSQSAVAENLAVSVVHFFKSLWSSRGNFRILHEVGPSAVSS